MSHSSTVRPLNTKAESATHPWSVLGQVWTEYRWPCLILAAHVPMLLVHFSWLWLEPQYQFFPILLGVVAYLVGSRLERRPEDTRGPDRRTFAHTLLALSSVVLAAATFVIYSPWLAMLSFIVSFGAVLMLISERFYLPNGFGIWLLLWLLLPLPLHYDEQLSRGAAAIHHVRQRRSFGAHRSPELCRGNHPDVGDEAVVRRRGVQRDCFDDVDHHGLSGAGRDFKSAGDPYGVVGGQRSRMGRDHQPSCGSSCSRWRSTITKSI